MDKAEDGAELASASAYICQVSHHARLLARFDLMWKGVIQSSECVSQIKMPPGHLMVKCLRCPQLPFKHFPITQPV